MSETQEPTGIGLKAAFLLQRELKRHPNPPTIEALALILDRVLRFEWAVRLVRVTADEMEFERRLDPEDGIAQFNDWAERNLIGPDLGDARPVNGPEEDGGGEVFCEVIGHRRPSLYPPPPPMPTGERES
jgi:hypothetical protein